MYTYSRRALRTVKAGETFELVLPSNSSTGYRWDILPELDVNVVQLADQNYIAEQPVSPGSGGVDVWTFRAVNAEDATVVLGYSHLTMITTPMKRSRSRFMSNDFR